MDYKKLASQFQIERDEMAYILVKSIDGEKENLKLRLLNDYVDFNASVVLGCFIPILIRWEAIDFILKNKDQLTAKFSIETLIEFSRRYNLTTACFKTVRNFDDLKMKYKKIA